MRAGLSVLAKFLVAPEALPLGAPWISMEMEIVRSSADGGLVSLVWGCPRIFRGPKRWLMFGGPKSQKVADLLEKLGVSRFWVPVGFTFFS